MKKRINVSRKKLLFILLFMFGTSLLAPACDIACTVEGAQHATYRVGDELLIKLVVVRTHRNCRVEPEETNITVNGMKITGATKWVNTTGSTWERKLKVTITETKNGKAVLSATRECNKEGGAATLTLSLA